VRSASNLEEQIHANRELLPPNDGFGARPTMTFCFFVFSLPLAAIYLFMSAATFPPSGRQLYCHGDGLSEFMARATYRAVPPLAGE
jgi:hypothetical protein